MNSLILPAPLPIFDGTLTGRGSMEMTEQVQKMSIVDVIVRERIARDGARWNEMAS